ncbi:hypothetical protein [Parapedobacter sp. 10938]|uniref:hypothetical protein n=1 Tax=Parapedobacter flavus TaxID=3110225 RepID=UPI002DB95142|nr:hypothetical protein [Parapedobacter sp. 10938]MEC3881982.1 hypothetical protein [Parapedobacter sp. 10938]
MKKLIYAGPGRHNGIQRVKVEPEKFGRVTDRREGKPTIFLDYLEPGVKATGNGGGWTLQNIMLLTLP